jgi:three-Cys-motif partner protein
VLKPKSRQNISGFRGFDERNYFDLFCGTGLCVEQESQKEVEGSSLIALNVQFPFSHYYFIDLIPEHLDALKVRAESLSSHQNIPKYFYQGDCNSMVKKVLQHIDQLYGVNLAVIDGFGIECRWSTIEALATCKRMDLIILFPQGMNINRNLRGWAETDDNSLDLFFGTDKWREIYRDNNGRAKRCVRPFLDLYQENLRKLGYSGINQVREQLIKSQRGQKLYYLIFASRHPLGNRFWKQTTDKTPDGQRRLKGY